MHSFSPRRRPLPVHLDFLAFERQLIEVKYVHDACARVFSNFLVHTQREQAGKTGCRPSKSPPPTSDALFFPTAPAVFSLQLPSTSLAALLQVAGHLRAKDGTRQLRKRDWKHSWACLDPCYRPPLLGPRLCPSFPGCPLSNCATLAPDSPCPTPLLSSLPPPIFPPEPRSPPRRHSPPPCLAGFRPPLPRRLSLLLRRCSTAAPSGLNRPRRLHCKTIPPRPSIRALRRRSTQRPSHRSGPWPTKAVGVLSVAGLIPTRSKRT